MSHEVNIICCPDGLLWVGKQPPLPRHPGNFLKQALAQALGAEFFQLCAAAEPLAEPTSRLRTDGRTDRHTQRMPEQPQIPSGSARWAELHPTHTPIPSPGKRRRPPRTAFEAGAPFPAMWQAQPVAQMETTDLQVWETWCWVRGATGKGRENVQRFWLRQRSGFFNVISREMKTAEELPKIHPGNKILLGRKKMQGEESKPEGNILLRGEIQPDASRRN